MLTQSERAKTCRDRKRARGLCIECGKEKPKHNRSMCFDCLSDNAFRTKKYKENKKNGSNK